MADLPILFSAPMVRALLDGRKIQTRRVLTSYCDEAPAFIEKGAITALDENERPYRWPRTKAVGDRLYVREHWRTMGRLDHMAPRDMEPSSAAIHYVADGAAPEWSPKSLGGRHRQGMHMPRWASRITLQVTGVRVERLQDCSAADAKAEGVVHNNVVDRRAPLPVWSVPGTDAGGRNAVEAYAALWDQINGPGAWDSNPWVAAISFTVSRSNIDQMPEAGE